MYFLVVRQKFTANVVVGLLVREFCCSGTDVSAKVLAMYADTRTPSMEPQWLAAGLSQSKLLNQVLSRTKAIDEDNITTEITYRFSKIFIVFFIS
mgnify:CR=1 FL=1